MAEQDQVVGVVEEVLRISVEEVEAVVAGQMHLTLGLLLLVVQVLEWLLLGWALVLKQVALEIINYN